MQSLVKKLTTNLKYSLQGLKVASISEQSFKLELIAGIFLLIILITLDRNISSKLFAASAYGLVLITELLNTAIEKICDKITSEHDIQIKEIKDIASAAVFISILLFATSIAAMILNLTKI